MNEKLFTPEELTFLETMLTDAWKDPQLLTQLMDRVNKKDYPNGTMHRL